MPEPPRNLASGSKVMSPRPWYPAKIGAVAAVYFRAAQLGLLAAGAPKVVSSAWPPPRVALAPPPLFGPPLWPRAALRGLRPHWTRGGPAPRAPRVPAAA